MPVLVSVSDAICGHDSWQDLLAAVLRSIRSAGGKRRMHPSVQRGGPLRNGCSARLARTAVAGLGGSRRSVQGDWRVRAQ